MSGSPASWGPSVVEAIQTRNVTCLAKKPIVLDPHIFDRKEAARGSRAREVTCPIQKWNIKAEGFHPILVARAEVAARQEACQEQGEVDPRGSGGTLNFGIALG